MSATRLLVLGVVSAYRRAHGYLVMNELLSWGADDWGNVKPGSIYHALRQLEKQGLLTATQIEEWPGRVDYEITPEGDAEILALVRDAIRKPEHRPDLLAAGLAFLTVLSRQEAIGLLSERLAELEAERVELEHRCDPPPEGDLAEYEVPPHVMELPRLWLHNVTSALEWTRGLIGRLEGGEFVMADEDPGPEAGRWWRQEPIPRDPESRRRG